MGGVDDVKMVLAVTPQDLALLEALLAMAAAAKLGDMVVLWEVTQKIEQFLERHPEALTACSERLQALPFDDLDTLLAGDA